MPTETWAFFGAEAFETFSTTRLNFAGFFQNLLFFTDTDKRKVFQVRLDSTGSKTLKETDYR
jgi:hypothetical protein